MQSSLRGGRLGGLGFERGVSGGDALAHAVERVRYRTEFVAGRRVDASRVVAGTDGFRGGAQVSERSGEAVAQAPADSHRDREEEYRKERDLPHGRIQPLKNLSLRKLDEQRPRRV